jgi:6-pyruvoyltetrahydropterin/6-carboxytetrahydropterin synthase
MPESKTVATRYHDISCGHRVYGHESKCAHFHGHNYRFHFHVEPDVGNGLDTIGRVMDFSVIKEKLCMWLETNWDHKFLLWSQDPSLEEMMRLDPLGVVPVPFNPTAENMAEHLLTEIGPRQLHGTGVRVTKVIVEETAKCHASSELE